MLNEKQYIYEQMRLIIEERRELTKIYFELKEKLLHLDNILEPKAEELQTKKDSPQSKFSIKNELENQNYILSRKNSNMYSYQDISTKISSILKESCEPLSNKKIFELLQEKLKLTINYSNLTNNILPKMNNDKNCFVEKVYRGFWQYRFK